MRPLAALFVLLSILALLLSTAVCQPSDTSYRLAWSEEFEYVTGTQPSPAIWNWQEGAGGWGNNELQCYTARPVNSYTNNSALVVQANWESYYGSAYTSARMDTRGKVEVYLGYVAARVRISMANGFWPAVWMMGASSSSLGWPYCGEIDFMEQVNGMSAPPNSDDHTQYGTVHYNVDGINGAQPAYNAAQQGGSINTTHPSILWGDDWHVYAFEWTTSAITFSVDNVTYATVCTTCSTGTDSFNDPSNPFYLGVQLAMGGSLPNEVPAEAALPGMLWVDWIRVWQKVDSVSYINAPGVDSSTSSPPSAFLSSSSSVTFAPSSSSPPSSTHQSPLLPSTSSTASDAPTFTFGDWSPSDPSYSLVWHEEFSYSDGAQPSANVWSWETGGNGWGNNELEYYTARTINSYVSDDMLIVAGMWENYGGRTITSARLTTNGRVEVYQGVIAARVRVQSMQNGYWPAVWMMGNKSNTLNWPFCGEIDFMEQVNGMSAPGTPSDDHFQHGSLHYNVGGESAYPNSNAAQQTSSVATNNASTLWGDDWHVYSFEWTSTAITFTVDDTVYSSFFITDSDYDSFRDASNPFYFLVDFAFGGNFPDVSPVQSSFPARMEVDWLRVWQQPGGSSYVIAPASTLVNFGSSSGAVSSSTYYPSSSLTASSSSAFGEVPLPSGAASSGGSSVRSGASRLRVECSACWLCGVLFVFLSSMAV